MKARGSVQALVAAALLFLSFFSPPAGAEPGGRVAAIRAEYLRLRNNDPLGDAPQFEAEWRDLFQRMEGALVKPSSDEGSVRLRMYAADTGYRLFRLSGDASFLKKAVAALTPVVQESRSEEDLGSALLMLGDLRLAEGADPMQVEALYKRAANVGGTYRVRAQQRLQGLRNGTFHSVKPSPDVAAPRIARPIAFRQRWSLGPVVLDPGHGGYDAGAIGRGGLEEKDVTLDVARRVRTILMERYSIPVLLTRDSDEFVPLGRRTAYANAKNASAFVSLHVNASPSHEAHGLEAYYLDNTDDAASKRLAERENGVVPGESVDDLSFMLSDLIQSGKLEDSIRLTSDIDGSLRSRVVPAYRKARFLGVKKAPFFVLVGAHMPCSLVEMFFVDHAQDGAQLAREDFRAELAMGIAHGIARFVLADRRAPVQPKIRTVSASNSAQPRRQGSLKR